MIHPLWGILIVRCAPLGHGSSHETLLRIGSKVRVFVKTGHAEQGMAKQLKERGKDLVGKTVYNAPIPRGDRRLLMRNDPLFSHVKP